MAILFEWYENPAAPGKEGEAELHARPVFNGKVGTDVLRSIIQKRSSLSESDVSAVLDALSDVMGEELSEGRQVHLDGIGYFYPTLKCTEKITASTPRRNTKIKLKGIQFRADLKLKSSIGPVKAHQSKYANHSSKLSDTEIDARLKKYFSENQVLTRRAFQSVCHMTRSTATNHLRRLREEGKLENIGSRMQPIYVPAAGYYGKEPANGNPFS